jgi:hypothetical protein
VYDQKRTVVSSWVRRRVFELAWIWVTGVYRSSFEVRRWAKHSKCSLQNGTCTCYDRLNPKLEIVPALSSKPAFCISNTNALSLQLR